MHVQLTIYFCYSIARSPHLTIPDPAQSGMDLQMIGFGLMATYHGNNEYALLSDMKDGVKILSRFIANFEEEGSSKA